MEALDYERIDEMWSDPEAFVRRVQARLVRYGISQGRLAEQAGYPPPRLSEWIGRNRRVRPSMETMRILDQALEELIKGGG